MKKTNWWIIIGFIIFTELIGFLSGYLAGNSREITMMLKQPALSPPYAQPYPMSITYVAAARHTA